LKYTKKFTNDFRIRLKGSWCVYCGAPQTEYDHFPPRSLCLDGFLIPCCTECNSLAGVQCPFDLKERIIFVQSKLRQKYGWDYILDWDATEYLRIIGF